MSKPRAITGAVLLGSLLTAVLLIVPRLARPAATMDPPTPAGAGSSAYAEPGGGQVLVDWQDRAGNGTPTPETGERSPAEGEDRPASRQGRAEGGGSVPGEGEPAPGPGAQAPEEQPDTDRGVQPPDQPPELPEARQTPLRVPVLLYHHLEPGADGGNGAIVSTEEFEAQIAWLAANGYTSVTTTDLLNWLHHGTPLPEKPVLITFDDGYRSNYIHAYPTLARHRMNAVIFVVTSLAGQKVGSLEYLSWDEMREMVASGLVEIQAHSHDGHRYVGGQPALVAWSAEEITADWQQLRDLMLAEGLPQPIAYAYPFGAHGQETLAALQSAGVQLGFTVERGYIVPGHDPYRLNRQIVFPGIGECGFARLLTGDAGACD
ncbi:MAG: polysaccharide deacetylase family protein [Symbiobacterium sp.]|uniref:polysaccharide deacetylase family protein n=1 Tax=Symbiobacterium sp. TaxID=1971213 RepID=UPI003463F765